MTKGEKLKEAVVEAGRQACPKCGHKRFEETSTVYETTSNLPVEEDGIVDYPAYVTEKDEGDDSDIIAEYLDEYLGEIENYKLLKLFVEEIDKFDAEKELIYQLGFRRQQLEEEWDEELDGKIMQESFALMDTAA